MKCDELEKFDAASNADLSAGYDHRYAYDADEVDAAIAELKEENESLLQQNRELCQALQVMYSKEEYGKLQKEIESLKASHYAEMVDAGMRERRLLRELWLTRAHRAEERKDYWYARSCHEGDKYLWSIDGSAVKYIGCIKRTNFDWLKVWSEVESKCLAKSEEY